MICFPFSMDFLLCAYSQLHTISLFRVLTRLQCIYYSQLSLIKLIISQPSLYYVACVHTVVFESMEFCITKWLAISICYSINSTCVHSLQTKDSLLIVSAALELKTHGGQPIHKTFIMKTSQLVLEFYIQYLVSRDLELLETKRLLESIRDYMKDYHDQRLLRLLKTIKEQWRP